MIILQNTSATCVYAADVLRCAEPKCGGTKQNPRNESTTQYRRRLAITKRLSSTMRDKLDNNTISTTSEYCEHYPGRSSPRPSCRCVCSTNQHQKSQTIIFCHENSRRSTKPEQTNNGHSFSADRAMTQFRSTASCPAFHFHYRLPHGCPAFRFCCTCRHHEDPTERISGFVLFFYANAPFSSSSSSNRKQRHSTQFGYLRSASTAAAAIDVHVLRSANDTRRWSHIENFIFSKQKQ